MEYWDWFIEGYCKVEFLCYEGEPNWLGWVMLPILGFIVVNTGGWIIYWIAESRAEVIRSNMIRAEMESQSTKNEEHINH